MILHFILLLAGAAPLVPVSHGEWMQKKGTLEGDASGSLALDRQVTIARIATVLARLKQANRLKIPHWASAQLAWAVQQRYITANKTFKIATNDFIAAGGDGYAMFKDKPAYNTGITLYELVEEALIRDKQISPKTDGRIKD